MPRRRAAEQSDELAPLRSITSSARASTVAGMRPYCLSIVRMEPTSVTQCRRERDQICVFGTS
jgi:hypothetical protein